MKVIWVLENIERSQKFYSKFNIAMMLASVKLWSKHSPEDTRVLYCDELTGNLMESLGVTDFWNKVIKLSFNKDSSIDTRVFWSSSKLQVLARQHEPVMLMDNDVLFYKRVKDCLDPNKICYCNPENGINYYPNSLDSFVQKLQYKTRWGTDSCNVGFLYLPDPDFTQFYAGTSLQIMKEFSQMKVPNSLYLIFAEQLLLKHLIQKKNLEYQCLIKSIYNCREKTWEGEDPNGLWNYRESLQYFKHYGPTKSKILVGKGERSYVEEMNDFLNCIGNVRLSNIEKR